MIIVFSREFAIYLFINPAYMIIILMDVMKFKTNWESGGNITWFEKESEVYEKVYY